MLALVRVALTRPYTFVVLALLILIIGPLSAMRTPTDIFPEIRIPVIAVVWQVHRPVARPDVGPRAAELSALAHHHRQRHRAHRGHILYGRRHREGVLPTGTDIRTANAQVTAISQTVLKQMPPNITPPLVLNYSAATVPIIQLALARQGHVGAGGVRHRHQSRVRTPLVTVPGAAIPFPFGGKSRQIQIDLDPAAMQSRGLSANDVANALSAQNLLTRSAPRRSATSNTPSSSTTRRSTSRPWPTCRSSRPTAPWSICATWRQCAMATDRRPISCMSTAPGRLLLAVLKNGSVSTLSIIDGIKDRVEGLRRRPARQPHHRHPGRPVGVREGRDQRRGLRGGRGRRPDQPDDPAVPGKLAFHGDHRHLDSRWPSWARSRCWPHSARR